MSEEKAGESGSPVRRTKMRLGLVASAMVLIAGFLAVNQGALDDPRSFLERTRLARGNSAPPRSVQALRVVKVDVIALDGGRSSFLVEQENFGRLSGDLAELRDRTRETATGHVARWNISHFAELEPRVREYADWYYSSEGQSRISAAIVDTVTGEISNGNLTTIPGAVTDAVSAVLTERFRTLVVQEEDLTERSRDALAAALGLSLVQFQDGLMKVLQINATPLYGHPHEVEREILVNVGTLAGGGSRIEPPIGAAVPASTGSAAAAIARQAGHHVAGPVIERGLQAIVEGVRRLVQRRIATGVAATIGRRVAAKAPALLARGWIITILLSDTIDDIVRKFDEELTRGELEMDGRDIVRSIRDERGEAYEGLVRQIVNGWYQHSGLIQAPW